VILLATARTGRRSLRWRRTHCQRFAHLGTTLLRVRSRNGDFDPRLRRKSTRQEMEHVSQPRCLVAIFAASMRRAVRS
jgi:hypothetical protein